MHRGGWAVALIFVAGCARAAVVNLGEDDAGSTAANTCSAGETRQCDLNDPTRCCGQALADGRCFGDGFVGVHCGPDGIFVCGPGRKQVSECTAWWLPEPLTDEDAGASMACTPGSHFCAPLRPDGLCFGDVFTFATCDPAGTLVCPPNTRLTSECTFLSSDVSL